MNGEKVSTVFQFVRDVKKPDVYSGLDKWAKEKKNKKDKNNSDPKPKGQGDLEMTERDPLLENPQQS